jgi:hypothetical protein
LDETMTEAIMHRDERRDRDDFGQADYSRDYAYDPRNRTGYRADEPLRARGDDYGQADYTTDWAYDPETGRPYRRYAEPTDAPRNRAPAEHSRSWMDRAGDFLGGRPRAEERHFDEPRPASRGRRGHSDRVLWAVIMERLEDDRRLDLRDVRVEVVDAEVILSGTVRHKEDKRRIEDIADIDGVRNVQNNLRPRERGGWTFL